MELETLTKANTIMQGIAVCKQIARAVELASALSQVQKDGFATLAKACQTDLEAQIAAL